MPTLHFKGKPFLRNYHHAVKFHNLISKKGSSLTKGDPSLDDNLIIHGDNLKALKALLPTHAGKVKCVYIDPPYNTGNENWVYNDNVASPMIQKWLGEVVAKDDLTRHDKWCCMMYPRLTLLRELLSKEGVIFVSIDNNEIHHLRLVMNEIFGEENFMAEIANINNPKGRSDDKYIPTAHEYLLVYKKLLEPNLFGWEPEDVVVKRYRKTDKEGKKWREIDLRKTGDNDLKEDRPNLFYYFLYNKKTNDFYPTKSESIPDGYVQIRPTREDGKEGNWRWELDTSKGKIKFLYPKLMPKRQVWSVFEMDYFEETERVKPTTAWTKKAFNSERGTEQFLELGFDKKDFSKPKPVGLLRHIFEFVSDKNDIILDSFAGSGTTAHAVLNLNKADGGNRKFILVECEDYADKITAERVRRVIKGVPNAKDETLKNGLGGSFSYFEIGEPIEVENILEGKALPNYEDLAKYVFFTATGEKFDSAKVDKKSYHIGSSSTFEVYLIYEPDKDKLKKLSLNLDFAQAISKKHPKKQKLVFAPCCFIEEYHLKEYGIRFAQLPFEIYRIAE